MADSILACLPAATASVAVQKDTTVAMGAACLLLMVGQATGDPLVFSRPSIANLVAAVLEVRTVSDWNACC